MTRPPSSPGVLALLSRLEAAGVRLALNDAGDGLRVYGEGRPRPEVMAEVKALKPALLAWLRGDGEDKDPAPSSSPSPAEVAPTCARPVSTSETSPTFARPEDLAPWEDGPQVATGPDNLPDVSPTSGDNLPEARRPAPPLPDWAAQAAKPGRCGSCARAEDASSEWGRYMVRCLAPPEAWWPSGPPLALHVGAVCGAYLRPGEEVGAGYRSKEAAKTWGSGQARRVPERGASL